jgi:hypothetical protein
MSLSGIDSAFTGPAEPNRIITPNATTAALKILIFNSSFLVFLVESSCLASRAKAIPIPPPRALSANIQGNFD